MPRKKIRIAAALAAAALVTPACGSISASRDAFVVDGRAFSRADLNDLMSTLGEVGQITVSQESVTATDAGSIISVLVGQYVATGLLARLGTPVTAAARSAVAAKVNPTLPEGIPAAVRDIIIDLNATSEAVTAITRPPAPAVAEIYRKNPLGTGVVCLRRVTVGSEAEALRVIKESREREGGLAAVAREHGSADGGIVRNGEGQECLAIDDARVRLGLVAVAHLSVSGIGEPTPPFVDTDGWHVLAHRPLEEVEPAHATALTAAPGLTMLKGALATADVRIHSMYGTWDGPSARIE